MFIHKNRSIREFKDLLTRGYTATKGKLSFAYEGVEDGYDPFEQNTTPVNLNCRTISGYVHNLTPEQLIYKSYGLTNMGAVEIIVEDKYYDWFKTANKIEIDDIDYRVMREGNADGTNSNPRGTIVAKRAFKMCRIVLVRN